MDVLVTGASRGLGFDIASHLSTNHSVVGCARRAPGKDHKFKFIDGVDFKRPISFSKIPFQSFDILINNVGIAYDGLLAIQDESAIENIIQVNLTSTLILTKYFVRSRLAARKPGIIVNVSSIIGIRGYAGLAAYSASKAGLDGATRALARELGPKGFRVNSVLPGYMETAMSRLLTEEQKKQIVRRTPLGRLAELRDVSCAVEFLISDKAQFITGQSLVVDGGITV